VIQKDNARMFRVLFGQYYSKEIAVEKNAWIAQYGYRGVVRAYY
jgi:hypothetical protein